MSKTICDNPEFKIDFICHVEASLYEQQLCFLPSSLLAAKQFNCNTLVAIEYEIKKHFICTLVPSVNEGSCEGLLSCSVISGTTHLEVAAFKPIITVPVNKIKHIPLQPVSVLNVSVVLKTIEDVLKFKKLGIFLHEYCLKNLLKLYRFTANCVINCSSNPLAKFIGISHVIIKDGKFLENEFAACQILETTKLKIGELKSLEYMRSSSKKETSLFGLDDIKSELLRIIREPWINRDLFSQNNIFYPKGILIVGPPGSGKSSLAKKLSEETGSTLVATSGVELIGASEYETLKNVTKVVKRAISSSTYSPCIFFIDEIDSLCPTRTKDSSNEDIKLSTQIMLTLDKCREYPYLVVMGATNRPFALDTSIRRSGRLEIEVLLNIPTEWQRKSIISSYLKDIIRINPSLPSRMAQITAGFVGADIENLCGKIHVLLKESNKCDNQDIIQKVENLVSSFTPSAHKMLEFITSKPSFAPVSGLDEVKLQLKTILFQHLKFASFNKKFKIKRPKGILLFGPRGCGKTRLVSEIASEQGCTFICATASHLLSPYVGDTEKRIAALFHTARILQPSIIFIDEIDGVFGSREGHHSGGVQISLLTEFLEAMDGAGSRISSIQGASFVNNKSYRQNEDNILVCGATNEPNLLDSALLRPGRFDKLIYIPPPDQSARLDILKQKSSKIKFYEDDLLEEVSRRTDGWTGAEVENLISQAAIQSVIDAPQENEILITKELIFKLLQQYTPSLTLKELQKYENFNRMSAL